MGASASLQTNVSSLTNSLRNEINQKATAYGTTKCAINVEKVSIENSKGCTISFRNQCFAEADVTMQLVSEVLASFYNNLTVNQKQEAASLFTASVGVNTSVTTVVNDFQNYLTQTCNTQAQLDNNITVKDVVIKNCTAPEGQVTALEFINTGTSKAICAMTLFNNLVAQASTAAATSQSTGLDWSKLLWPIAIVISIIASIYLIGNIIVKKIPSTEDRITLENAKKDNYSTRIANLLEMVKIIR